MWHTVTLFVEDGGTVKPSEATDGFNALALWNWEEMLGVDTLFVSSIPLPGVDPREGVAEMRRAQIGVAAAHTATRRRPRVIPADD
jgi:hypothetical protein